jgi:SAM-dependent methyltransferase
MNRAEHWDHVYRTKAADRVSWFQPDPRLSRELIEAVAPDRGARIVDVGGGASRLADGLLDAGYQNITVLDISEMALGAAQAQLGDRAPLVRWIAGDVLSWDAEPGSCDVWHDRAVFHFLNAAEDRARYLAVARRALRKGGHAIIATFAADGPTKCSGLDVSRYSPLQLAAELSEGFVFLRSEREIHSTPVGAQQAFTYAVVRHA